MTPEFDCVKDAVNPAAHYRFDEDSVRGCLNALDMPFGDVNGLIKNYNSVFVTRYTNSLNFISHFPRGTRVLELAASPFGMSAVMRHHLFDDIRLASFGSTPTILQKLKRLGRSKRVSTVDDQSFEIGVAGGRYRFEQDLFNAEADRWPYEDESFDLVICCEMIEHMAFDPMHIFAESNRVLRNRGALFVSTPNASCLQNLIKIATHRPPGLCQHYRAPRTLEGIYKRHSRELTPGALSEMFRAAGFEIERSQTTSSYPLDPSGLSHETIGKLESLVSPVDRGDTLNIVGVKISAVRERYPTDHELYLASERPLFES